MNIFEFMPSVVLLKSIILVLFLLIALLWIITGLIVGVHNIRKKKIGPYWTILDFIEYFAISMIISFPTLFLFLSDWVYDKFKAKE